MLIEITDFKNPVISHFEQGRDFYAGAKETNLINVRWPKIDNSFITLSFENIRGKVFGPVYSDSVKVDEGPTYKTSFNITNSNVLVPGDLQITVYLNISNASTAKVDTRYCLGRVVGHVKKSSYVGSNIIMIDEDTKEIVSDFNDKLETLNSLVNRVQPEILQESFNALQEQIDGQDTDISEIQLDVRDLKSGLNEATTDISILKSSVNALENRVANLKPIRTVNSVPNDMEVGEYIFLEIN